MVEENDIFNLMDNLLWMEEEREKEGRQEREDERERDGGVGETGDGRWE